MASTPKMGRTKEIIGMRVKEIEDYRNDFDDLSYSDSSIAESFDTHSMRLSQQGLIRNSFQVLLPIGSPATSVKLPLTQSIPKDNFRLNSSEDDEDFLFTHDYMKDDRSSDTAATAEQLLIFEALIKEQIEARDSKVKDKIEKEAVLPPRPKTLHKEQLSLLELDEDDSSHTREEYDTSSSDGEDSSSEDSDDSDASTSDKSSSWGSSEDNFDEGGTYTYFAAITAKPNTNATIYTLTPFESVVEDATKSLKIKYEQVIYPTGSKFHSRDLLETEDYHRLQNIQFVKWIKSNNELKTDTDIKEDKEAAENALQQQMIPAVINDIFVWLKKSINLVYTYYRGKDRNDLEFCYHLIDSSIFQHFVGDGSIYMLSIEDKQNYELFKLFELLLHTLGRLCSKLHGKKWVYKFYEYLELTKKMFPIFKVHLDLLKQEFKAHQDKRNANHCIQSFVEIYYRNRNAQRRANANEIASFELCVKALVALDLYMENYSPLNHSILSDKAAYDINSESFKWLDAYNKYQNKYNHNDEMDPNDIDPDEAKTQYHIHDNLQLLKLELCSNPQARIDKLSEKYEEFTGFSLLRARCSWVIGHSMLYHQRQFYESEKYFFEALYCLKALQQTEEHEFFPLNGTMQTELASLVLIDYADVLLENKKYQYAINTLECVINCFQQRQKQERQFQIIRKLCMICTEKEDWNRAIKYHNITLKKLKDNYLNLNEFVYLSQQISTIHLKLNNFAQSECELQNGIKTIYLNVLSQYHDINVTDIDNLSIHKIFEHCEGEERISIGSLLLMLANLYISGGNYLPQAIHILNYLKKEIFTNSTEARLLTIYFQLARAYFKNGRYSIADDLIENEILVRYSSRNKDLLSSLEFVQLRILTMIHCKRFDDALSLLEDAMTHNLQKESFVKRAKINYLKGRVLQSRCFNKLIKSYNTKEEEEEEKEEEDNKDDEKENNNNIGSPSLVAASLRISNDKTDKSTIRSGHRRQHGDVGGDLYNGMTIGASDYAQDINPLDAISALLLSHSDYKSIDPIMQAKCCLELSKTYLEIMMEYYALPHFVLRDIRSSEPILSWLGESIFNDSKTPNNEVILHCLDEIYHPLHTSLRLSTTQTKDIGLLIESYIALAEFEFLKTCNNPDNNNNGETQTSKNFWKQSKITLFSTYRDSDDWIFLRRIDRHSRLQIFSLFKRILRLLICFDNKFIADNVEIFVSYLALETFMIAQKDLMVDESDLSSLSSAELRLMITRSHRVNFASDEKEATKEANDFNLEEDDFNSSDDEATQNEAATHMNPTVTLRICDLEMGRLSEIASAGFEAKKTDNIRPLLRRYRQFNNKANNCERDLDELFRMHWKMRTDANMFSGGRLTDIDNDESLAQITKCINSLNVKLNRESTLHRSVEASCLNHAETFLISLDSIVFMFHPHTLCKYAIHNINNMNENNKLKLFSPKLQTIAFHDNDFLSLSENPWIKIDEKILAHSHEKEEKKEEDKDAHNERVRNKLKQLSAPWKRANMRKKALAKLSDSQRLLLRNEMCLPSLKLESVSELLMCLDPQNILAIFGAIFSECPIIIVSKERCRCLAIIDALFVLMYPFSWQYPMISWLSPYCFELLNVSIPYIFGVANCDAFDYKKYVVNNRKMLIIDADTNNVIAANANNNNNNQLPLKLKSKLTRAMFRLMSGLLKTEFIKQKENNINRVAENRNWVFPPRRRDNMQSISSTKLIRHHSDKYNLLSSPRTAPISICSERKIWYISIPKKTETAAIDNCETADNKMRLLIINFQKEFCTAWVEVLEQYRLFWCHIDTALDKGLKEKSDKRIQKYAHPRYRKFLTKIQKTRMFSSFQCIRSLANNEMLKEPMFDNLVMRSLRFRQGLYHEIIQQQQRGEGYMKVSVENNKKRHFFNHHCTVRFNPKDCSLIIIPHVKYRTRTKDLNLSPFKVELKATIYELEADDNNNTENGKHHPYCDRKQVLQFGDRYQFKIVHENDGILTCNCQNYYQLTRWIHILRAHSMDTWSWSIKY